MTQIPENMTEDEVMIIIDRVANRLARKFRFGYHDVDDMKQQARMYAWKGLDAYDNTRPLENFLWTHVRNRLFNFKRDNYERPGFPCTRCPLNAFDPNNESSSDGCTAYEDKMECSLWERWTNRNCRKKNIMNPITIGNVMDEKEDGMKIYPDIDKQLDIKEFFEIIDKNIPLEFKADLIRVKNGIPISKPRRERMYQVIRDILEEKGLNEPETW